LAHPCLFCALFAAVFATFFFECTCAVVYKWRLVVCLGGSEVRVFWICKCKEMQKYTVNFLYVIFLAFVLFRHKYRNFNKSLSYQINSHFHDSQTNSNTKKSKN
jgi:flagellar biosynthesis protein FlhB